MCTTYTVVGDHKRRALGRERVREGSISPHCLIHLFWNTTAPACPLGSPAMLIYPSYAGTWIRIGGIRLLLCSPRLTTVPCSSLRAVFACSFIILHSLPRVASTGVSHLRICSTRHRTTQLTMPSPDDAHPA